MDDMFGKNPQVVPFFGRALGRNRRQTGVSQVEFARRCGWSQQYQSQLESGQWQTVTVDTAKVICQVFTEIGAAASGIATFDAAGTDRTAATDPS